MFRDHAREMEKARQQVLTELESFSNNTDVVFQQKTKPVKEASEKGERFRGSLYRGVSVNGKSWQVFIVINKCKWYAGWVESEEKAAAIYDRLAIVFHGLKVIVFELISFRLKRTSHIRNQMCSYASKLRATQITSLLNKNFDDINFKNTVFIITSLVKIFTYLTITIK